MISGLDRRRARRVMCVVMMLGIPPGCQTYSPRPLNPASLRAEFLARSASSEAVAQFAQRLRATKQSPPTFDPTDGLSVEEGEVVAMLYNADLRRARARAGVTAASAAYAGLWEDPVLGTDLVRILESTAHPWKVFANIGLTIPLSGRLEKEKRRAGAEHDAELRRVFQAEWETRVAVRREWAQWTAAVRQRDVIRELIAQLDGVVSIVERIEHAGELARIEASLFRIERSQRSVQLTRADERVAEVELRLRRLIGLAPSADVAFVPAPLGASDVPDDASADEAAQARNPRLALARALYEVAERRLELEIRKQYPDLHIGPGYGREGGSDQIMLGLSVPVPMLSANRQGIATAGAERESAEIEYAAAAESIAADLSAAWVRLHAARARRRIIEDSLNPLVEQQYTDARRIADLGEVNTLLLLETLTRQQDAKLDLISAGLDVELAAIEIAGLVGPEMLPDAGSSTGAQESQP
ncbi:MAG: TolC family protein [Phycisphaerales bacterium]